MIRHKEANLSAQLEIILPGVLERILPGVLEKVLPGVLENLMPPLWQSKIIPLLGESIVPQIIDEVPGLLVKPTGGSRPRVETLEERIRCLYDLTGNIIKCPLCERGNYTSGTGYLKHFRVKHPKSALMEPVVTQGSSASTQPQSSITFNSGEKVRIFSQGQVVAYGTIDTRRDVVHGYHVQQSEEVVCVDRIVSSSELTHPQYGYPIEANSFIAWERAELKLE